MPEENKKKLVELITKHNIPLIEDDVYGELYLEKVARVHANIMIQKAW